MRTLPLCLTVLSGLVLSAAAEEKPVPAKSGNDDVAAQEAKHLGNQRQVTFGLPRAGEGYFSPDGKSIVY